MSSDQLLASAEGSATARGAHDQVVVPLQRAGDPLGMTVRLGTPRLKPALPGGTGLRLPRVESAAAEVAQIIDYRPRARRPAADDDAALAEPAIAGPASRPTAIANHADELDRLLRNQIESHLDLIASHAPDLARPVDNVRRSVELLLKLRQP